MASFSEKNLRKCLINLEKVEKLIFELMAPIIENHQCYVTLLSLIDNNSLLWVGIVLQLMHTC